MRIFILTITTILFFNVSAANAQQKGADYKERLILGMKIASLVQDEGQIKKMYDSMMAMFGGQYQGLNPVCVKKINDVVGNMAVEMTRSPEIKQVVSEYYADRFTLAELKEVSKFMQSPAGKKFFLSSGEMTSVVGPVMMKQYQNASEKLTKDMMAIGQMPECQQQ